MTPALALNEALFDQRMALIGHRTEASRSHAIGVSRMQLHRIRKGSARVSVDRAVAIAALLSTTVDQLFIPRGSTA